MRSEVRPSYKTGFARCAAESANPHLWNDLAGCWAPMLGPCTDLVDHSGYKHTAFSNTLIPFVGTSKGPAADVSRTGGMSYAVASPDSFWKPQGTGYGITMACCLKFDVATGEHTIIGGRTAPSYAAYQLDALNGTLRFFGKTEPGSTWCIYQTGANLVANKWYSILALHKWGGGYTKIFVNGTEWTGSWTSGADNFNPALGFTSFPVRIGTSYFSTGGLEAKLLYASIHRRLLSRDEILQLTADDYALFRPKRSAVFFVPAAGGGFQPAWATRATQVSGVCVR